MSIVLLVNLSYYFKKIESEDTLTWNWGENGEYFQKLFKLSKQFIHKISEIYFVVLENSGTTPVEYMARKCGFLFYQSP